MDRAFLLSAVLFSIYYQLYVMPDALSVTVGGMLANYLAAWLVWRAIR